MDVVILLPVLLIFAAVWIAWDWWRDSKDQQK